MKIYLNPTETAGGGTTTAELPTVTPKAFSSQQIPNEVLSKDFSIEDFDVEQLPEHGGAAGDDTEKVVKPADTKAPEVKPAKAAPKVEDTEEDNKEEKEVPSEEPEEEIIDEKPKEERKSVLKPPTDKKTTDVKTEKTTEQPVVKENTKTSDITPPTKSRDYSGLSDTEAKAAKQMSNEAFTLFKQAVNDRNEASKQKDSVYLQHPDAYALSPEFRDLRTSYSKAGYEAQYWESQLEAIDKGEQLVPFLGWNNQGQPVMGNPMQPTKALEERVRQNIMACNMEARRLEGEVRAYPTRYKESLQRDLQGMDAYRKDQFSWVADESLLDHSVDIPGLGERSLKQIREDVSNMIPSYMRNHPLANMLGDTAIAIQILRAEKAQLEQELSVKQKQASEQELVEPSSKGKAMAKPRGEKVHGIAEFRVDPSLGV